MTIIQEINVAKKDNENGTNVALAVGSSMENISAHGIPNIKRAQTQTRRLLWVCAFLVSFSICVWQIISLLDAYYSREITTNMDIKSVTSLVFPAITICNMNGMRYSYITTQSNLQKSLSTIALKERDKYQDWDETNLENHEIYFDMINVVTKHVAALPYNDREIIGHNLSEAMLSCTFNGYPCLPSNFTYKYNYLYGNCYTFNDGTKFPVLNNTRAGPLYGLTLEIDIDQNDYIEEIQPAAGLKVVIHDQTEMPFPEDQGVTVSPGTETSIAIYKVEYERLPAPFPSKCLETEVETLFSRTFSNITYSKLACMKSCQYMKTFKLCGCYISKYVFDPDTTPVCTFENETQVDCVNAVEESIATGNVSCNCGPACTEVFYRTSTSSSVWPGCKYMTSAIRKLVETPNLESADNDSEYYIKNNFAKVNIYYEILQYDSVKQVAMYSLLSLISNIGGHLGLWIGMSALTLLEFLECFYDIGRHTCAALIRGRKNSTSKKKNRPTGSVALHPQPFVAFQNDAFSKNS